MPEPPSSMTEIQDLISIHRPRTVVHAPRPWMVPYFEFEERELRVRHKTSYHHTEILAVWLRQLRLFHSAFTRDYDSSDEPDREVDQAIAFRLDLLGLAGSNSKLALDALLAGNYSGSMAIERHMLETWRRVAYARLCSADIWRWYDPVLWPTDVKPLPEGRMPQKPPSADDIGKIIEARGSDFDRICLTNMRAGFEALNDFAHPTIVGAAQSWTLNNSTRRVFGPGFNEDYCHWCLTWGLAAGVMLLEEVVLIDDQGQEWREELNTIRTTIAEWQQGFST